MIDSCNYTTIEMKQDYQGEVVVTLISHKNNQEKASKPSILYIHGFVDYFFHPHLAEAFVEQGHNFYALELRKYGHSLLVHQKPNYCRSLEEYYEDIDAALDRISGDIILLGHSTGGLTATLYALYGSQRERIRGVILNSPFYRFNKPVLLEHLAIPLLGALSRIFPGAKISKALSENYPMSIHKDYYGEWDFDLTYKPIEGFPAYLAWFRAIVKGQRLVWKSRGTLEIPVLLLCSSHSVYGTRWSSKFLAGDSVLNVKDIKKVGHALGPKVTGLVIPDGLHDIYLSPEPIRSEALAKTLEWCSTLSFFPPTPVTNKKESKSEDG